VTRGITQPANPDPRQLAQRQHKVDHARRRNRDNKWFTDDIDVPVGVQSINLIATMDW
jgi:hypothetical protein